MKYWIHSKVLWVNTIGIVAIIAQGQWGYVISPEIQVSVLAIINLILRTITTQGLSGRK